MLNADGRTMAYSGENGHEVRCLPYLPLPTKLLRSFFVFPFFILVLACTFMMDEMRLSTVHIRAKMKMPEQHGCMACRTRTVSGWWTSRP